MRRALRPPTTIAPTERLARAVGRLPPSAVSALGQVAERDDLPLVAGSWQGGRGGCLVANTLAATATRGAGAEAPGTVGTAATVGASGTVEEAGTPEEAGTVEAAGTLDVRMLEQFPELSSRDLNRLIVAWDEAAAEAGADDDASLRVLLRDALALAAAREPEQAQPAGAFPPA